MRRLLAGLLAAAVLAFAGLQSAHAHAASDAERCCACALGAQTARQAPAAAPEAVRVASCAALAETPLAAPRAAARVEAPARAPPSA